MSAKETIELRLAAPLGLFQVNLIAELGEVVAPATLQVLRGEYEVLIEIPTIPGDPWFLESAETPAGPWRLNQSGNADSTRTRILFSPDNVSMVFFRARSP